MRYTFNVFDGPFGLILAGLYCVLHSDGTVGLKGHPAKTNAAYARARLPF